MPYGRCVGSCWNSTPRPLSSSYVALAVVGREEQPAGGALGHERLELLARLLVEHGRAGHGHQRDRDVGLAGQADREPAEVAHLGDGDVLADLHAELLGVEGEGLVLVVDPDVDVAEGFSIVILRWSSLNGRRPR